MSEIIKEVYATKYCLSTGKIMKIDAEIADDKHVIDITNRLANYHNEEWHYDEAAAFADAEKRRQRKIISLKKQIEKLEKLKFSIK